MTECIDLGIDAAKEYDDCRSISLVAAAKLIRGRMPDGTSNPEVVTRYANPRHGYRPHGAAGPVIVLPTVRLGGSRGPLRTMPEWVKVFERARVKWGTVRPERAAPAKPRGKRSYDAAQRRARKVLDEAGIG